MASESEIKAISKFNKYKTRCINLRLNLKTDADILKKLDEVPSKMGYIKDLIRNDICNK